MLLGRYELGEKIASGGMGEVFRGRMVGAEGFHKLVAIKCIFPDLSADELYRRMFVREAQLVANLTHPNIVQVFELGESQDELYIVMEYVYGIDAGRLLGELARQRRTLSPPLAAVVAFDALSALEYAHQQVDGAGNNLGIVHRDVSPQNLLISRDGFVKLCDFGIARVASSGATTTRAGTVRGKLPYVAPEQFKGAAADGRTDIFSLGVVLHELLTGMQLFPPQQPPLQTKLAQQGVRSATDGNPLPGCPTALATVIETMLRVAPEDRYQHAAQCRAAIEEYLVTASPSGARDALAALVRELMPAATPAAQSAANELAAARRWTSVLQRARDDSKTVPATVPLASVAAREPALEAHDTAPHAALPGAWLAAPAVATPSVEPSSPALGAASAPRGAERKVRAAALIAGAVGLGVSLLLAGVWLGGGDGGRGGVEPEAVEEASDGDEASLVLNPTLEEIVLVDPSRSSDPGAQRTRDTASALVHEESRRRTVAKREGPARSAVAREMGFLSLNSRPWARVTIDGRRLDKTTPLLNYALPVGEHELRLESGGGKVRVLRVSIKPQQTTSQFVEF